MMISCWTIVIQSVLAVGSFSDSGLQDADQPSTSDQNTKDQDPAETEQETAETEQDPGELVLEEGGEEMVVTGTKRELSQWSSPVSVEVIDREEIEASGNETVVDMLEDQIGITVVRSVWGTGIRMQGLDPKHTLILIDGRRTIGSKGGHIDLSRIPLESIERIEIVKGPQSALYGSDAMGGVVNLITKQGIAPRKLSYKMRLGTLQDAETLAADPGSILEQGLLDGHGSFDFREGWFSNRLVVGGHLSDGFDLDPSNLTTNGSAFSQFDIHNQSQFTLSADSWIATDLSYLQREIKGTAVSGAAILDRTNLIEDAQSNARWTWVPDTESLLTVDVGHSYYRDQYLSDQRGSDDLDQYQETVEKLTTGQMQYDRALSDRNWLSLGFDGFVQEMTSPRLENETGDRYRFAVYAQDMVTYGSQEELTIFPGVRSDYDSWFGLNHTPKLAMRYAPNSSLALRASYSLGFRAPDFKEMFLYFENKGVGYRVEGNPYLEPEKSESAQLGVDITPIPTVNIAANVFNNNLTNLITVAPLQDDQLSGAARFSYVNVGEALTQGLETRIRCFLTSSLRLQGGYTYTNALNLSSEAILCDADGNCESKPRKLTGQPTHQGTASLQGKHRALGLSYVLRLTTAGHRPFYLDVDDDGQIETVLALPYNLIDARVAYRFPGIGELALGVDNLTNEGDPFFNPLPPRMIYSSLSGDFGDSKD